MPPDVDAYAAAVDGRALATKCRGGYTAQPIPETQYYFPYKPPPRARGTARFDRETVTQQRNWDGRAFGVSYNRVTSFYRELDPGAMFQMFSDGGASVLNRIVIPKVSTTQAPFRSARVIFSVIDKDSRVVLRAYNLPGSSEPVAELEFTQSELDGSSDFTANGIEGYVLYATDIDYTTPSMSLDQAISGFTLSALLEQTAGATFEFYARLEGGVGSILEADEEGNQTELQTVNMTVRHDNRFRVGDWIAIPEQPDLGYQIHSVENVGRLKWQTLTLKQEALA